MDFQSSRTPSPVWAETARTAVGSPICSAPAICFIRRDALSSFHVVDLGRDGHGVQPQACKVLASLLVESRCADPRVHQVNHDALRMRGPQVVVDDLGPLAPGLLGGARVSEAREIDEVEGTVDPKVVDRLGPAGGGARARQLPAQQLVQQARLADIRAPGEGDLRAARRCMNPSLPAADLMNSDVSIFSADSGAHPEFSLIGTAAREHAARRFASDLGSVPDCGYPDPAE